MVSNQESKKSTKFYKLCIIWVIVILMLIGVATTYADLDKIPHRDEGMFAVETLYSSGEITGVGESYHFIRGRRRKRQHNLHFFIDEIHDYSGMRLPEEELDNYHVGDKVTIMREVYYLKPGFRMFFQDSVVEILED